MTKSEHRQAFFAIELAGVVFNPEDLALIDNIIMEDNKEDIDIVTFEVIDPEYTYQEVFYEGMSIKIVLGWLEGASYVFIGEISEVAPKYPSNAAPSLKIKCLSRAKALIESQSHRVFRDMPRSDIAQEIAESHGLTPYIHETDTVQEVEVQAGMSDGALMTKLAANENYVWKIRGNAMFFGPEGGSRKPVVELWYREETHDIESINLKFDTGDKARKTSASQLSEKDANTVDASSENPEDLLGEESAIDAAAKGQRSGLDDEGVNFDEFVYHGASGGGSTEF